MTAQEAEARIQGQAPPVLWNLTARDGGTWGPDGRCLREPTHAVAFTVTAEEPTLAAHTAGAYCKQFRWLPAEQGLTQAELATLQSQGLPAPPGLGLLVASALPAGALEERDLYQFCAEVWTWLDQQGIRDAWRTMLAVGPSPEEQKAALLAALPASMKIGPDEQGNYRAACGARRTPGPALLGPPCTGGRCLQTKSGQCWRRWGTHPDAELVEVISPGEVEAVEVEVEVGSVEVAVGVGAVREQEPKVAVKKAKAPGKAKAHGKVEESPSK